jgi:hypothetical protein
MTKRRPAPLGDEQKKQAYIREHLYSELRWLLDSATEWSIQDQLKLEIEGYEVQVYAMDSAFIHARNLFEFFLTETTTNHYGADQFLGDGVPLKSEIYTSNWKDTLHKFLMHASDRSLPSLLKTLEKGVEKHLNQMPVEFAREILRLWEKFEARLVLLCY